MATNTEIQETPDYMRDPAPHEEGVTEGMVVSIVDQAEINQQIATAHRYPRSLTSFRRNLYQMVTIDTETAESCIYALPRDGKMIDGPSIRFAELLLVAWGNNRAATEVSNIDEEFITAAGMFFDLETNSAISAKVMRRITGKPSAQFPKGKRFGADMIQTTGNAACSIALRNSILRGVPKALWKGIWDEAKKVAGGTAQTFTSRRDKVMKELGIQGATPDQIFGLLGVKGLEDIQTEHLVHLRGLQNAIKDGETTLEEAFGKALKPGEVEPQRPTRSEFDRPQTDGKAADAKAEPAKETVTDKAAAAESPKEGAKATPATEPARSAQTELDDWYADQKKELANTPKVRDVADLRDMVAEQLDGERLEEWDALCAARTKAILDATRTGRKK